MLTARPSSVDPQSFREILRTWWPLAASWLLMGAEMPLVAAAVARLPSPEVHLAAWGSVVFPVALIVEAPIIMLLAASTALCRDGHSYRKLARFTAASGAVLTAIHALVAFTPLYDSLVVPLLKTPAESIEPGRLGLQIMTPWTWAIADRRFHQGILIRSGKSRAVGLGTLIRLLTAVTILVVGSMLSVPGIVVAASAIAGSVTMEMIFARIVVADSLRELRQIPPADPPLSTRAMLAFYYPLALTPLLTLLMQPIGSGAMGRMPEALACLATWPAFNGLIFLTRSPGFAFHEVVVRHADRPQDRAALLKLTRWLAAATGGVLLLISCTPFSGQWFHRVSGMSLELTDLATHSLWLAIALPPLTVYQNFYSGLLTNLRRTRAITEAVALHLLVTVLLLNLGVVTARWSGLQVVVVAYSIGSLVQAVWLRWRWTQAVRRAS
jgi:hypothetical protein